MPAPTAPARTRPARLHGPPDGGDPPRRLPLAWAPVLAVAAVKVGLNLVAAPRYGWHRDELYYVDAGRHLALGYVDFPAAVPLVARFSEAVFGAWLVGLRTTASLAGAATVVVTACVAAELGGGRRAQVLAAVAVTPLLVGSNALFQTVSFDQLAWALVIWAAAALLLRPDVPGDGAARRGWLLLGAAAALAWSTKHTAGMLFACLAIGWLTTRSGRATLRGRGPALAPAVVVVGSLPNLWWQARHGWPSVAFVAGRNAEVRGDNPPAAFWAELALVVGVAAVPLAVAGVHDLCRRATTRPLGVALALVAPLWLLAGGKGYYAAPLVVGAFAAGAVRWEHGLARCPDIAHRHAWRYPAVLAGTALLSAPFVAPFLPTSTAVELGLTDVREDYAEQLGWPELARTVDAAWGSLTPELRGRSVVLAADYGVAGAVERFGRHADVEVVSGHLQWRYWPISPRAASADHALLVGFDLAGAGRLCDGAPRRVGTVTNRWGVDNEEAGGAVWACDLVAPIARLRRSLTR